MNPYFIYYLVNPHCKDLFLAEIAHYQPEYRLSFNQKNLFTFKSPRLVPYPSLLSYEHGNPPSPLSDEFKQKAFAQVPIDEKAQPLPAGVPSRAYFKIKTYATHFFKQKTFGGNWLDLGAAPGGALSFLLPQAGQILAVDPAPLSDQLQLHKYSNCIFFNKPISELHPSHFTFPIHYIHCDINLAPSLINKQIVHLVSQTKLIHNHLKMLFFTCKIADLKAIADVLSIKKSWEHHPLAKKVSYHHYPVHHQEGLLWVQF